MSITITAIASGSVTPIQSREGQNVVNGDFLIVPGRVAVQTPGENGELITKFRKILPTGNGIDEETSWTFHFDEDPNISRFSPSEPLTQAILTLTLTPTDEGVSPERQGFTTDAVLIESLPLLGGEDFDSAPEIHGLPAGVTNTITIDLLNRMPIRYKSEDILRILFSVPGGTGTRIVMRYNDDAIISFAQLDLTQESPVVS